MKKSIFLLAMLPLLGACSSDDVEPLPDAFSDPDHALRNVAQTFSDSEARTNENINDFTLNFLDAINDNYSYGAVTADHSGNFVVSPVSAAISMIMAANFDDVDGAFRLSLRDALGLEDFEAANSLCGKLIPALQNAYNGGWLRLANAMWYSPDVNPEQQRCDLLDRVYDAEVACIDFAGDTKGVKKIIEKWISSHTGGMIRSMSLDLDPLTKAFFISAIYFQSEWDTPFDAAKTSAATFKGTESNTEVMMMNTDMSTYAGTYDGYTIACVPYKNRLTSLYLILPPEGSDITSATAQVFDPEFHTALTRSLHKVDLTLDLPRINVSTTLKTYKLFEALGIDNRSSFHPLGWEKENLDVFAGQSIALQWDEEGTKFAIESETEIILGLSPTPEYQKMTMTLDRPFLFMIVNTDTGTCLLAGRICNL